MSGDRDAHTVTEQVPDALAGERLDRVVAMVADVSRKESAELIAGGAVRLTNRTITKVSHKVAAGQTLVVEVPAVEATLVADPSIEVPVVFADEHVIVVDKPAGLVVHPGAGTTTGTMVHGLLASHPDVAGVGDDDRPGLVHRLDKGTSGLLVVARTPEAHADLVEQLAERTVHRVYRALVHGHLASDEGLIDAPLGRSPRDPLRQAVVADGREARTWYTVAARRELPGASPADDAVAVTEVICELETGRTHQIRVHLAAIGHPVVADTTYQGRALPGVALDRPFLHAQQLGFVHPATDEDVTFTAELPADLTAVLEATTEIEA